MTAADATSEILEIAGRQHGVLARAQMLRAGIGRDLVRSRVVNRRLLPIFPGVYALGTGSLGRRGRWMAAVLAAGRFGALSHRSAAALHGLIHPGQGPIEAVRPGSKGRHLWSEPTPGAPRFAVVIRHTRRLPDSDVVVIDRIPVTSVERTLLDLAAVSDLDRVRTALAEAERLRAVSLPELLEMTERGRGWRGIQNLRRAVREFDSAEAETRSELEVSFLRLCRHRGIPQPAVNVSVGEYMVDFFWSAARLIVEVDGFEVHGRKDMFRGDRRRDVDLILAGYRVARFTYYDIVHDSEATSLRIKGLLSQ